MRLNFRRLTRIFLDWIETNGDWKCRNDEIRPQRKIRDSVWHTKCWLDFDWREHASLNKKRINFFRWHVRISAPFRRFAPTIPNAYIGKTQNDGTQSRCVDRGRAKLITAFIHWLGERVVLKSEKNGITKNVRRHDVENLIKGRTHAVSIV